MAKTGLPTTTQPTLPSSLVHGGKIDITSDENKLGGGTKRTKRDKKERAINSESGAAAPPSCRLLECAREALRTRSVVIQKYDSGSVPDFIGREKKVVAKKKKRKRSRTTVVTSSSSLLQPQLSADDTSSQQRTAVPHQSALYTESDNTAVVKDEEAVVRVQPLLVLDLNGILCHRIRKPTSTISRIQPFDEDGQANSEFAVALAAAASLSQHVSSPLPQFRPPVGHVANTPVVARTDLADLLSYLDQHFALAVWTSAKRHTAKKLVDMLFPKEISSRLLFIWGQNWCEERRKGGGTAMGSDVTYVKSLSKVWNAYPLWNHLNTLIVDDSPEKCPVQYVKNAIHPPSILGHLSERLGDDVTDMEGYLERTDKLEYNVGRDQKGGDASTSPLGMERSSNLGVPCIQDDLNQRKQADFFHELAEFWKPERVLSNYPENEPEGAFNKELISLLERAGGGHMGWRGVKMNHDLHH